MSNDSTHRGRWDPVLWLIVSAFVVWELVAHYALGNVEGHTLSNRIKWPEHAAKVPVQIRIFYRVVVACACIALGVHLEGVY